MHDESDELRDDILAVLRAGTELRPDDQPHLADIFLHDLRERYDLIPRAERRRAGSSLSPDPHRRSQRKRHWRPLPALALAFFLAAATTIFDQEHTQHSAVHSVNPPLGLQTVYGEVMTYPSLPAYHRDIHRQQEWGYKPGIVCTVSPALIRVMYVSHAVILNRTTVQWWTNRQCDPDQGRPAR